MTGKLMLEDRTRTTLIPKYHFLKLDTYMYHSRYNVWGNVVFLRYDRLQFFNWSSIHWAISLLEMNCTVNGVKR